MTFSRRRLEAKFELGTGNFGQAGVNVMTIKSPVRMRADITYKGQATTAEAHMVLYGVPLDIMAKLTVLNTLGLQNQFKNTVTISAGDDDSGVAVCFVGTITECWADMQAGPDSKMVVSAFATYSEVSKPVAPTSYRGSVDVATIIAGIAARLGLALENNGVTTQINSTYLAGGLRDQLRNICEHADIQYSIETPVLAIWPKGGSRNKPPVLISKETGMVGYPAFTQSGIELTTLYNPSLLIGGQVKVKSLLSQASGLWSIFSLSHNLESEEPNGPWFSAIGCNSISRATPLT